MHELCARLECYSRVCIYITHLHWDHFHGPTIRALCKELENIEFVIPKTPEPRLYKDLREVVSSKFSITEVPHNGIFQINNSFHFRVFLSGIFVTDSAVLVTTGKCQVLNLNDSKPQKRLSRFISRYITTDRLVSLRSHSSANARACRRTRDGRLTEKPQDDRESYSRQFIETVREFETYAAIPYASNMCYLHDETYEYNESSNTADLVKEYAESIGYKQVRLVLPKESMDLLTFKILMNDHSRSQLFENRQNVLREYKKRKLETLIADQENSMSVFAKSHLINSYFNNVFRSIPWPVLQFIRYRVSFSPENRFVSAKSFTVDMPNKRILWDQKAFDKSRIHIIVPGSVLNSILRMRNFDSLGISKRLYICADSYWRYRIFLVLLIYCDIGIFPINKRILKRLADSWIQRKAELVDNLELFVRKALIKGS